MSTPRAAMSRLRSLVRNLVRRRQVEREVHDELTATFELLVEEGIERGLKREDAVRAARLELGSIPAIEDHIRDVRAGASLRHLLRDLRHAARTTVKRPGIPLLVVLAFGLGSAGVTTTFALVHGILLAPLPYPEASRIVTVMHAAPGLGLAEAGLSTGTYFHYRDHATSFESIAVYSETVLNLSDPDAASERVHVTHAGRPFFDVLGVRPALGRAFTAEDEAPGFMDTRWAIPVLLSHDFWTRRFGADAAVVGRTIALGGRPREVVGVMPAGFSFPRPETQIWMLFQPPPGSGNFAARLDFDAIGLLRSGVDAAAAARDLERALPAIVGAYPDATAERFAEVKLAPVVVPLKDEVTRDVRGLLWLVFGASGVLLLVACANAAALMLLRAEGRSREMAVRIALGARRVDVARLFFSDAVLYSTAAAACGVLVAHGALEAVVAFTPIPLPRLAEVQLDWQVIAFTCLIAALGTCVFGAVSFLRTSALASKPAVLRIASGPADLGGAGRARSLLVAVQVALALSLLVGSALMVQSFSRLTRIDPGFDAGGVLSVELGLPGNRAARHQQIYRQLLDQVGALPGVWSASAASSLPLDGTAHAYPFQIDRARQPTAVPIAMKFVMTDYFETMRTPVLEGVGVDPTERVESPYPVWVSSAFARRHFPGRSAIGRTLRRLEADGQPVEMFDPSSGTLRQIPVWTIAGVVADVADESLRAGPAEIVYVPIRTPPVELSITPIAMTLVVRSDLPPAGLSGTIRQVVHEIDGALSVGRIRPMEAIVSGSIARERFLAVLLLISAATSLLLGAIGVYGVAAQSVRRREQEIGIRMALGAQPGQIAGMVLREAFALVLVGLTAGVGIALAASRALLGFLYGVSPSDPVTMAGISALLLGAALLATALPARRAARLDPVVTLRTD